MDLVKKISCYILTYALYIVRSALNNKFAIIPGPIYKKFFVLGNAIGDCITDTLTITAPGAVGPPIICGNNKGYHSKYCNVF